MSRPSECEGVRARLLDGAELAQIRELEGAHVEGCAACRAALARVEAGMAALADGIGAIEPRLSTGEAVALAKRAGTGTTGDRSRASPARRLIPSPKRQVIGRRRLAWVAGPAAALAAAILGIVWEGPWRPGGGVRPPPEALVAGVRADAAEPGGLSVEAPETGGVAVFATRDPDIHVVWFYDGERSPIEGER